MMGASNPHPHCQIWANLGLPIQPAKRASPGRHWRNGRCLLCDYLALERAGRADRVENEPFVALVPFWAVWPFETLVLPGATCCIAESRAPREREHLADILELTTTATTTSSTLVPVLDGLPPGAHGRGAHPDLHLHAHYYPPLLRSATVRKFMVGYELLASPA